MPSSDSEDDYMKMTFTDAPALAPAPETSLQRRQRERREAEQRARVKSKAELAAEETSRREALLSTSLLAETPACGKPKSKGLAMMAKMGFTGGGGGGGGEGVGDRVTEPIRVVVKDGREGIGLESERKRKLREAAEAAGETAKRARVDEGEYRERVRREREEARLERQVKSAQKVAERMDDERAEGWVASEGEGDGKARTRGVSSRPLKSVPVVYRSLVKGREEAERERRMRHDLEQSSLSRLPGYEDPDEDEDDRTALGKSPTQSAKYVTADDLDDEDAELDDFNALALDERLGRVVQYLRDEHQYCFWCKFSYPGTEMDGCPGLTEEDHD